MPATKGVIWYGVSPEGLSWRVRTSPVRESRNPYSPSGEYGGGTAAWCNGSTSDFGSDSSGSNPDTATDYFVLKEKMVIFASSDLIFVIF